MILLFIIVKHSNKVKFFPYSLVQRIAKKNFKIAIIGDNLNIKNVKNFGFLKNKKVQEIQSQSRFTIASGGKYL